MRRHKKRVLSAKAQRKIVRKSQPILHNARDDLTVDLSAERWQWRLYLNVAEFGMGPAYFGVRRR